MSVVIVARRNANEEWEYEVIAGLRVRKFVSLYEANTYAAFLLSSTKSTDWKAREYDA